MATVWMGWSLDQSEDALARGVAAFNRGDLAGATAEFEAAVKAAPNLTRARLHLAHAYLRQVGTKTSFEENRTVAGAAVKNFRDVLSAEPANAQAMASLGSVYLSMGNLSEARLWCQKAVVAEPKNPEAHFALGFTYVASVNRKGVPPRGGSAADTAARTALSYQVIPMLDTAIQALGTAVTLDPNNHAAMGYLWLALVKKAELTDPGGEQAKLLAQAGAWLQRSTDTKNRVGARLPPKLGSLSAPPYPPIAPPPPAPR
jgi:tetratricopeptide (TPR) repeat protein